MARHSAANLRRADSTSHKLTDYFPLRSTQDSSTSLSQPPSSQPAPSQATTSTASPAASQQPRASQTPSQPRLKLKPNEPHARDKKRKANAAPRPDQEVISLSSTDQDSVVVVAGHRGPRSRPSAPASISTAHDVRTAAPDAVIVLSDSSATHNDPPHLLPSASPGMKTRSKGKKTAAPSISTATRAQKKPSSSQPSASTSTSAAKTTVRKRVSTAPTTTTSFRSGSPIVSTRKRKHGLQDFDSPSEDSADGSVYIARPDKLGSALSHAPETLRREDLITPRDPSTAESHRDNASDPPSPSKRPRLTPPESISQHNLAPPLEVPREEAGASSGNEADEEEIPSSQSDEHELTIPKAILKNPHEVKARVDEWRRSSGVGVLPAVDEEESPLTEPAVLPSDGEATLSSGMGLDPPAPEPEDDALSYVEYVPPDSFPNTDDDHMEVDQDLEGDGGSIFDEDKPAADPVSVPSQAAPATQAVAHESEEEVSQHLQTLPQSSSASSLSTLSSGDIADPADPATPPPQSSSLAAIASTSDSPLRTSPSKTYSDIFRTDDDARPATPIFEEMSLADLPPTPAKLDPKTKTFNMIEKIKAEARAKVEEEEQKEDSPKPAKFDWEESDDDSELDFKYDFSKKDELPSVSATSTSKKPASSASAGSASGSTSGDDSARYNFRRRSSPKGRKAPEDMLIVQQPKPQRKDANPLSAMLREKQRADRKGIGMDARREAEEALASEEARRAKGKQKAGVESGKGKGKGKMMEEMDEEDLWNEETLERLDLGDEDEGSEGEDAEDAVELLGAEDGGAAVRKILKDDRDREQEVGTQVERGVRLFEERDEDGGDEMDVDVHDDVPKLPFSGEQLDADPILSLLRITINTRDTSRLCTHLTPIFLTRVKPVFTDVLVSWLLKLAMWSGDELLAQRANEALFAIAQQSGPSIHLSQLVLSTVLRLGARTDAMANLGLTLPAVTRIDKLLEEKRNALLSQLLSVIKSFAQHQAVSQDDIADLVMALLPVAMDPTTSPELGTSIMLMIDHLCGSIPSTSSGYSSLEQDICARILAYARDFTPANQAYMLSFLCSGCPQSARMTRWLARRMILGNEPAETYASHPPLEPLIAHLSPSTGSQSMFDILGNAENTEYYDELAGHVEMLNMVFNDVDGYVQLEEQGGTKTSNALMSPGRDRPLTELEQTQKALDRLHGKIVDTHTIVLARTRAKAALQQLSVRIHYTRAAAKGRGKSRQRGLGLRTWLKPVAKQPSVDTLKAV